MADKPRMSLVPMDVLWQVIAVLEFGAKRYGNDNWQKVDNARTRYFVLAIGICRRGGVVSV